MTNSNRTYSELIKLPTLEERFQYLNLRAQVGQQTFGWDRWMNQMFYRSREWKDLRHYVIDRDHGCDLALPGFEIHNRIIIHHMNPMTPRDIIQDDESILDPEVLITTTHRTHNAIHFGDERQLPQPFVERRPGDTKRW